MHTTVALLEQLQYHSSQKRQREPSWAAHVKVSHGVGVTGKRYILLIDCSVPKMGLQAPPSSRNKCQYRADGRTQIDFVMFFFYNVAYRVRPSTRRQRLPRSIVFFCSCSLFPDSGGTPPWMTSSPPIRNEWVGHLANQITPFQAASTGF